MLLGKSNTQHDPCDWELCFDLLVYVLGAIGCAPKPYSNARATPAAHSLPFNLARKSLLFQAHPSRKEYVKKLRGQGHKYWRKCCRHIKVAKSSRGAIFRAVIRYKCKNAEVNRCNKCAEIQKLCFIIEFEPPFVEVVLDGLHHDVDSSVLAFELASRACFKEACYIKNIVLIGYSKIINMLSINSNALSRRKITCIL